MRVRARLTSLITLALLAVGTAQVVVDDTAPVVIPIAAQAPQNRLGWAYVSNKTPAKGYLNKKTYAPVGRSGKAVYRSYFRMSLAPAVGKDTVTYVRLRIPVVAPNPCREGGAPAVQVYLNRPLAKTVTWKKQPKAVKRLGVLKPVCSGKMLELDVTKAAVAILKQGGKSITLGMASTNEKNAKSSVRLSNAAALLIKAADADPASPPPDPNDPLADPAKNPPAPVTDAASTIGACAQGAAAPTTAQTGAEFTGNVSDPDGGFVGLRIEWQTLAGGPLSTAKSKMVYAEAAQPKPHKVTLPVATFADGTYRWRAQAFDDFRGGDWTPWCEFTVAAGA